MTDTVKATKKADIDPNFKDQISSRKEDAQKEGENRILGKQVEVMAPKLGDWDGDLFDYAGINTAFKRKKANEDFVKATSDATSPGVTGDLIATTLQVDYLAIMGRAYLARHTMSFPRAVAHQSGRKIGQGTDKGSFGQSALEFIRQIVKQSS